MCVNLSVIIYHISNKKAFHTDELWTYAHANSSKGAFLDKEIDSYFKVNEAIKNRMFNKWLDGSFFYNYITVQKNETFTYYNVYKNLSYHKTRIPFEFYSKNKLLYFSIVSCILLTKAELAY